MKLWHAIRTPRLQGGCRTRGRYAVHRLPSGLERCEPEAAAGAAGEDGGDARRGGQCRGSLPDRGDAGERECRSSASPRSLPRPRTTRKPTATCASKRCRVSRTRSGAMREQPGAEPGRGRPAGGSGAAGVRRRLVSALPGDAFHGWRTAPGPSGRTLHPRRGRSGATAGAIVRRQAMAELRADARWPDGSPTRPAGAARVGRGDGIDRGIAACGVAGGQRRERQDRYATCLRCTTSSSACTSWR